MHPTLLSVNWLENDWWYALPLVIAISLVYAATRHERLGPILRHALRVGMWIVGFMAVVLLVLVLLSWQIAEKPVEPASGQLPDGQRAAGPT